MNRIFKEQIAFDYDKSYRVIYPLMRNTFFWHCHPEIELVYIEANSGIRHVGTHVSSYNKSDLVLIGSNLPHLNFDYQLGNHYTQIVVQLRTDFLGTGISHSPELHHIYRLFSRADQGLAFGGRTKEKIALKLKGLKSLSGIAQLLDIVSILDILAKSTDCNELSGDQKSKSFLQKDKLRMGDIYKYIEANFHQKIDISTVAEKANLTKPSFCRYFKRQTLMTFTEFVNQYRIERAKHLLLQGKNVNETCYAIGFENFSYFSILFKKVAGTSPSKFKQQCTDR